MTKQTAKNSKQSAPTRPSTPEVKDPKNDPSLEKAFICAQAVIDKKAENVKILDLSRISGFTDYFVICSAMSDRQVQAIADSVDGKLREIKQKPISVEGHTEARWVLIDCGDVIVHVFLDALRDYYDIETLWADAPRIAIPAKFFGPATGHLSS